MVRQKHRTGRIPATLGEQLLDFGQVLLQLRQRGATFSERALEVGLLVVQLGPGGEGVIDAST